MARGRRGGRGGAGNPAQMYQLTMDLMQSVPTMPNIINGIFTFSGNQMSAQAHFQNFPIMTRQYMANNPNSRMIQANISIVGSKVKTSNGCCYTVTICFGSLLIFPLCFMCCGWWKKIAYPLYEISLDTYKMLGNVINSQNGMTNFTLSVVDNGFNAQKALALYQVLSHSQLTGFTFINKAMQYDYLSNEVSDFAKNMAPIKSLPFPTSITWGDMII